MARIVLAPFIYIPTKVSSQLGTHGATRPLAPACPPSPVATRVRWCRRCRRSRNPPQALARATSRARGIPLRECIADRGAVDRRVVPILGAKFSMELFLRYDFFKKKIHRS